MNSNGYFPDDEEGRQGQEAFDRLVQSAPAIFTPIVVAIIYGDACVTLAGVDVTIEDLPVVMKALTLAHEVSEQDPTGGLPEDGGDNLYIIGRKGKNIVKKNIANIPADTPFEAVVRFIASQIEVDIDHLDQLPSDLKALQAEKFEMRRSHDWKAYDFDGLVESAAEIYNGTLEAMSYRNRSEDVPDPWS